MSRILEEDTFKKYLEKYGEGKIDLNDTSMKMFLRQYAGAILMLVPEATCFLVEHGLPDDPEVAFLAMASLGATLKEIGEEKLNEIRKGGKYEDDKLNSVPNNLRKLCH